MGSKKKRLNKVPARIQQFGDLSDELREYIIKQLGAYRTRTVIYKDITSDNFWIKHGFEGLNRDEWTLQRFRNACSRIKKREIEHAHTIWLNEWRGLPFATSKGRVEALTEAIAVLKDIKEDRTKYSDADSDVTITELVNNIRKLLRDIRREMDAEAEREAKAASGTNIYIGRSLSGSEITPELLNDTFIALFAEYGTTVLGLHHWNLEQLTILEQAVTEAIQSKRETIETEFEVIEDTSVNE